MGYAVHGRHDNCFNLSPNISLIVRKALAHEETRSAKH